MDEMNLEKEKGPRVSQHHMGWNAQRTFPLLPVAGEIFLLTFPFIALATLLGGCMNQKLRQRRRVPGQKL